MDEKIINKYVIETNTDGYVTGFYAVLDDEKYDYEGQMADFPEATEGWCKFENNTFVVDEVKKAEIIAEREKEAQKPTWQETTEAQVIYTAMMTDTLIEPEEVM